MKVCFLWLCEPRSIVRPLPVTCLPHPWGILASVRHQVGVLFSHGWASSPLSVVKCHNAMFQSLKLSWSILLFTCCGLPLLPRLGRYLHFSDDVHLLQEVINSLICYAKFRSQVSCFISDVVVDYSLCYSKVECPFTEALCFGTQLPHSAVQGFIWVLRLSL